VVPALVAQGNDVTVLARSAEKSAHVASQGAVPARVDLFDPGALATAIAGHGGVVNLVTHIPPVGQNGKAPGRGLRTTAFAPRVSARLVEAALDAGARRFVQESIAYNYPERGDD
jgi:2-alkyl-3-oxoalkanoate reductase